jgi:hypothetical protein
LWLYITALAIIIGGSINAILDEFTKGDYTKESRPNQAENEEAREEAEKHGEVEKTGKSETVSSNANRRPEATEKSKAASASKSKTISTASEEKTYGKMIFGGILGGLISYFSKKKK